MKLQNFKHIYVCSGVNTFLNKESIREIFGHNIIEKGKKIIFPLKMDEKCVSPKNFILLKEEMNIEKILILDRLKGAGDAVCIYGHINRSGKSFLRGKTPENGREQFPDMSFIYSKIEGMPGETVCTLGQKRFLNPPKKEKQIWSEAVGLISVVAHYVGMRVYAIGENNRKTIKQLTKH